MTQPPPDYADFADATPPIDMPDDYGTDDADESRVIAWLAAMAFVAIAICAACVVMAVLK